MMILAKLRSCEQQANAGQSWVFLMVLIGPNSVGQMHPETIGAFSVIFQWASLPVISWCKKWNSKIFYLAKSTNQKSKSSKMIWLAGFTELFNWFLSLNSIASQLPVLKGWIFQLAEDTWAKQHKPIVMGKKTHISTRTSHTFRQYWCFRTVWTMEAAMLRRSWDVLIYQS